MKKHEAVFYEAETGERPPAEFMKKLKETNFKAFKKCAQYIRALEEQGLALPYDYLRHVEGDIWELRPEFGGVEYRLFFGTIGADRFGVVSGYQKTWDKVPEPIKRLAAERIREMRSSDG